MKKLSKEFDISWWEECNSKRLSREKVGLQLKVAMIQ